MESEAQTSDAVLLVRPAAFGFHAEAAASNAFARPLDDPGIASAAQREFDALARQLSDAGVDVHILEDAADPAKPDAVFPNNWVSFHGDGTMVLYPMATEARRLERNPHGVADLLTRAGFDIRRTVDLTLHEAAGKYLEGTGSLTLDRPQRLAFASISPRTNRDVIKVFDKALGYSTITFPAHDRSGQPIYHTNVLLSLGGSFAVLCADVVAPDQRPRLVRELEDGGRSVILADYEQLKSFACNIIELRSTAGEPLIAMSSTARRSFRPDQQRQLEGFGTIVDAEIPTIEAVGGGSVRCMIADIHLPRAATRGS